jgi:tetratricopeptide (TPR) repeat protein
MRCERRGKPRLYGKSEFDDARIGYRRFVPSRTGSSTSTWIALESASEDAIFLGSNEDSGQPSLKPPSARRETHLITLCLLLVAATLAFYNPIIHNQFIDFDDSSYILKNSWVQSGLTWDTVKWSFTTFREGNWHPLTWLSHALDCQVFRLNPAGHHYTNLLLHAANAVLLFLLLRQATGVTWPSLIVGALFALHPVNVESVAWAAERKNVLSMLFFLLALHAYDRYGRTGRRYLYLLVTICFALGLMAKPQIVTLPFVLLFWDYWPLQRMGGAGSGAEGSPAASTPRSFRYLVWEKLPLFILAAADSVVTMLAQRAGNAVRTVREVSLSARLENVFVSYVRYIGKALWPSRLAAMYPRPANSLPAWQAVGAVVLLLLISALVLRWRDRRYLPVGWFWFLGTLVPMIGFVTVGEQTMADRYAYLPFIGLFVAIVWTLDAVASKRRIANVWRASVVLVVVLILGCLTYRQLGYWHDDETLWRQALHVTEGNYMAHNNLAIALAKQGRSEEAVVQFQAATALHKYPPDQVLNLAFYELRVGHPQEAIEEAEAVLRASPDPKVQSAAWGEIGQAHLQSRHYGQAAECYQNALRLNPENGMALMGSGVLALRQRQFELAVAQLMHAARVEPNDLNVLLLAQALRRAGHAEQADLAEAKVQKISSDLGHAQLEARQWLSFAGLEPLSH